MTATSRNFGFLEGFSPTLCAEASRAEQCFAQLGALDLAATGFRRYLERLIGDSLRRSGRPPRYTDETLFQRLERLQDTGRPTDQVVTWLHEARKIGNKGSHAHGRECSEWELVELMRLSRKLAVWWVCEFFPDADVVVPGFKVPQSGDLTRDAKHEAAVAEEEAREAALSEAQQQEEARKARLPRVIVHSGLGQAWERLSADERAVLTKGLEAFRADPTEARFARAGLDAQDEKLALVRLEGGVHLVIAEPAGDDVVFVLWAAPGHQARGWATSKRVEVHPQIGTVQLYDVEQAEAAIEAAPDDSALFDAFGDDELVRLGLPEPLLAAVRAVTDEVSWTPLSQHLPQEAAEALELLLVSGSVDEVEAELGLGGGDDVDPNEFGVAAEHPASKQRFRMLEPDEDLEAALDGSIEAWRLYLHPDQRALVRMRARGPVRVLGGAGTGKTVALLHRAAHLLQQERLLGGRIFVTTFTKNLASDLQRQLGRLVGRTALGRADVLNVHSLAYRVAELPRGWERLQPAMAERLWEAAHTYDTLGLPAGFYREEWEQVMQARGLTQEKQYLLASRAGSGRPLGRKQRRRVWKVLATFAQLKDERRLFEAGDLVRRALERIEAGDWESSYRAVLADEVQDLSPVELKLLRALTPRGPDDLFLVGDAHQRIYGHKASMRSCGIDIQGRSRRLRVNYRTTAEIRDYAVAKLEGLEFDDLDGGVDTLAGYRSVRSGRRPVVLSATDDDHEVDLIVDVLARWRESYPPEALCVAARTRHQARRYREQLAKRGHPSVLIQAEEAPGPGLRVATMHRLKGLEFSCVLIAGGGTWRPAGVPDEPVAMSERSLQYVAATRARDELVATTVSNR